MFFNVLLSRIGREASWPIKNIETFSSWLTAITDGVLRLKFVFEGDLNDDYKISSISIITCKIMTFCQYAPLGVSSIHLSLWRTYHSSGMKMVCVLNVSFDEPQGEFFVCRIFRICCKKMAWPVAYCEFLNGFWGYLIVKISCHNSDK